MQTTLTATLSGRLLKTMLCTNSPLKQITEKCTASIHVKRIALVGLTVLFLFFLQGSGLLAMEGEEGEVTPSRTQTTATHNIPQPTNTPAPPSCINNNIDIHLRCLINRNELTGDPSTGRNLPDILTSPLAQLGRKLFFTTDLGGENDAACVSCHLPYLGGGDALSLSIGNGAVDFRLLGPGRQLKEDSPHVIRDENGVIIDPGPTEPRNAPTTFNVGLLDSVLFWDGRIESKGKTDLRNGGDGVGILTPDSLASMSGEKQVDPEAIGNLPSAQAMFPPTSPIEMKGTMFQPVSEFGGFNRDSRVAARGALLNRMKTTSVVGENQAIITWAGLFQEAGHTSDFTFSDVTDAIAEYERSQLLIMNPWKAYVQGSQSALSDDAKKGAILFLTPLDEEVRTGVNGAGCIACHTGDAFTDEKFHVVGFPQIGRGGGRDKLPGADASTSTGDKNDTGRFFVTGNDEDLFAFKTPTLLNVEVTFPYGHAGSYTTLEAVVTHYSDPMKAVTEEYDFSQLMDVPAVQTDRMIENTRVILEHLSDELPPLDDPRDLKDIEVSQLVEFMTMLTDPCVKNRECLDKWVPSENELFPGKLIAHDPVDDKDYKQFFDLLNDRSSGGDASSAKADAGSMISIVMAILATYITFKTY